jgi:2-polyprenyl-3-methyl-5-hydroxy-6-metoxy-1,4-benzoquinol methylase/glycosyltransferase involved in cell wall biosynthesis
MENYQKYERIIYKDVEESLSKIANLISSRSIVLDIGCGSGMLGRFLIREKGCIVDGVDGNSAALEICQSTYRFTAVKNLEADLLSDVFQIQAYDYIVVADVLEHLTNPDQLLSELKKLIKPQGTIIFSVPNITHISVALDLLLGRFEYTENGLLDETHLRFYTRQSLLRKLESFGLHAWEIDTVEKAISETEFSSQISKLFPRHWIDALTSYREDSLTYQWLISTKIYSPDTQSQRDIQYPLVRKPSLLFTSELYWADEKNPDLTDDKKLIGHSCQYENLTSIDFLFSEANCANGLSRVRIDPVSDRKPFLVVNAEIRNQQNDVIWTWNPTAVDHEFYNAKLIANVDTVGCLFQAINDDPQWHPLIDKEILARITTGWIFRLVLGTDDALISLFNSESIFQSLNDGLLAKRDEKIADLLSRESELQALSDELRKEVNAFRISTSWRVTKPLRYLAECFGRFRHLVRIYQKYQKTFPGLKGFLRLTSRSVNAFRQGGFRGLKDAIFLHEYHRTNLLSPTQDYQFKHSVLMLQDVSTTDSTMPEDVAVHVHIYYSDMAKDIRLYLENIPVKFHLYVTTDTVEKLELIKKIFSELTNLKSLEVVRTDNRGRDLFPMLVGVGNKLVQHELVLHIHTKRSPHNIWELAGWRRYLFESLLGNSRRIAAIFEQFMQDKEIGILFPSYHHSIKRFVYLHGRVNDKDMEKLLLRAGKKKKLIDGIDRTFYPAGDMFWFRGKAIKPFIDMALSAQDFEPESGQVNNTLAHAIERMFPYFASEMGLTSKAFLPESFLSESCSAHKFELLKTYIERGYIVNPTILFDHNGGGGTTTFTRDLVKSVTTTGESVLRIYCYEAVWFVHWIGGGDGMLFYTRSFEELFDALSLSNAKNIIVNSMYGYLDLKEAIAKITSLAKSLNIPLDVKMHDFYAVCPSPHLLDFEGKYCGIPENLSKCDLCVKKNLGWYHSWYPLENRPTRVSEWRKSFNDLFEAATTITFFDQSSIAILSRAFSFDPSKARILPHSVEYFHCENTIAAKGPLHIATLGTLSIPKGGNVVNALYQHINAANLKIPVTVLGASVIELANGIKVYGSYENSDLPNIIKEEKINLIFISSIIPETFSYTISEAMKMRLPIVAFDIGAQGNRVKQYVLGKTVPADSSPEVILEAMQSVLKMAKENK